VNADLALINTLFAATLTGLILNNSEILITYKYIRYIMLSNLKIFLSLKMARKN
jgi:hypothetical protein